MPWAERLYVIFFLRLARNTRNVIILIHCPMELYLNFHETSQKRGYQRIQTLFLGRITWKIWMPFKWHEVIWERRCSQRRGRTRRRDVLLPRQTLDDGVGLSPLEWVAFHGGIDYRYIWGRISSSQSWPLDVDRVRCGVEIKICGTRSCGIRWQWHEKEAFRLPVGGTGT